jgi:hypothetical protein
MSQGELLAHITRRLDHAGIPHMVVGSLAGSFHGEPRTTRDIDIVIDPSAQALHQFVDELPRADYYVDENAAIEALRRRASFNIIEMDSGWKVDLMVRKEREFSRTEFDRRIPVRLLGTDTLIATAEDTIVAKLEWAMAGESERQLRDVAGILAASGDVLDRDYVERWIAELGLNDVWSRARELVE